MYDQPRDQCIISVKDTSILSVIGLAEIVNKAKTYVGKSYQFFSTYIFVAGVYLALVSLLMVVQMYVEKKLSTEELMLLNCGVGEDSCKSLGLQGDQTSQS